MSKLPDSPDERAKAIQDMLRALSGAKVRELRTAIRLLPLRERAIARELGEFIKEAARD